MAEPPPTPGEKGGGILDSLRGIAAALIELIHTRLELLVTELEEERVRILELLLWAAGALFFFGVGVLLLTVLLVAVFWDNHRIAAVVLLAAIFFAIGLALAFGVRNRLHARSRLFSTSLDELERDKNRLTRP